MYSWSSDCQSKSSLYTGFATCQIRYVRVLVVSLPIGKVQNLHPRMDKLKKNEKYIKIFF